MKQIALLLIAIAIPAGALAQELPKNPLPAAAGQPPSAEQTNPAPTSGSPSMWERIERLPRGQRVKIRFAKGRWERCEFAGATDAYLYCAFGDDSGFVQDRQIDRAAISDFKVDHDVRNGRLVFAAFVIAGGVGAGFAVAHQAHDEGAGVFGGLLGALISVVPGSVASCLAGHCVNPIPPPAPVPPFVFSVHLPLRSLARHSRR